ncbi:hypothetical protein EJD97_021376 [Solanum chilense]|uniref:Uncharacterized protein n=1 Tax=Solanum chilense TaxID=4083 RepID=A0A6N2AXG2_SOLCI|nr:hypothetical protein EJD97_021376 [Solanum chilense]
MWLLQKKKNALFVLIMTLLLTTKNLMCMLPLYLNQWFLTFQKDQNPKKMRIKSHFSAKIFILVIQICRVRVSCLSPTPTMTSVC